MAKDEMIMIAAVLIAVGMVLGSYMISQGDYAPKVDISDIMPNVYVSSQAPDHAISATGEASTEVTPDELVIGLHVETQSTSAKESQEDNADVMADLRSRLTALGIKDNQIKSSGYSVDPVYDSEYVCEKTGYPCHYDSKLLGYKTMHILTLKLSDLDKGGEIIDAASKAGENQTFMDYISFTLKDETRESLEKTLLEEASGEAKQRAESIASGLGASLGKPLSARESYSYTPYYYDNVRMYAGAESSVSAMPTVVSPGEVEVSIAVDVSYEIS